MELIPILSTIILVATISTFLLAIGAYILYKIREKKQEKTFYRKPSTYQTELVLPVEEKTFLDETQHESSVHPDIEEYSDAVKFRPERRPVSTTYKTKPVKTSYSNTRSRTSESFKKKLTDENKYLKYTSEGYITPQEDRDSGAIKWR